MATFTPKYNWQAGDENNPYYTTWNQYYGSSPHDLWMPNCVAWAAARGNELADYRQSWLWPNNNGSGWYEDGLEMGYQGTTQFVPQVGAIMCFDTPGGGDGHVAVIEEVHRVGGSSGPVDYVITSNSFYNSTDRTPQDAWPFFALGTIYANDLDHIIVSSAPIPIYHQPFIGILYNPAWPPGIDPTFEKALSPIFWGNKKIKYIRGLKK